MKTWKKIVIHCSASFWGSAPEIRKWHTDPKPKGNGWSDIGYHYVIDNGFLRPGFMLGSFDGSIEVGRQLDGDQFAEKEEMGAHAYGFNRDSIGICLVGKDSFTAKQMSSLLSLVNDLQNHYEISSENVVGHYELDPKKTCPNINMSSFRDILKTIEV